MPTSYTTNLRLALPATGELAGIWGTVVNDNITKMVEEAITGVATISTWPTNIHTLTEVNGATSEARCAALNLTGVLTATGTLRVPDAVTKTYIIRNGTTGGYGVAVQRVAGGTSVTIPNGYTAMVYTDGSNVGLVTPFVDSTGDIVGDVTGNVTGNLTGNVTGNVTGNLTGGLINPTVTGTILEDVYTITDGVAFEIDPGNGSIQLITLGANRTPKATNFAAGEVIILMVDDGSAYTITWTDTTWGPSGVVWMNADNEAPELATTGYTTIAFWKVGSQVYGTRVGS